MSGAVALLVASLLAIGVGLALRRAGEALDDIRSAWAQIGRIHTAVTALIDVANAEQPRPTIVLVDDPDADTVPGLFGRPIPRARA